MQRILVRAFSAYVYGAQVTSHESARRHVHSKMQPHIARFAHWDRAIDGTTDKRGRGSVGCRAPTVIAVGTITFITRQRILAAQSDLCKLESN